MNIVVTVKQIPDPAVPGELNPDHTLKREGKLILDESDSYGVEMALQLVDKAGGGDVILVSMAPNGEVSGLRTALAMGAASAILVSDDALHGADALTTAKVLAKCVERAGERGPRHHRDGGDRRLHRNDPRADRPSSSTGRRSRSPRRSRSRTPRRRCSARPRRATTSSRRRCPRS